MNPPQLIPSNVSKDYVTFVGEHLLWCLLQSFHSGGKRDLRRINSVKHKNHHR